MKIYKCSSLISLSVVLPNGSPKHVSFDAMSDGTSLYFTDNKDVQKAIESHSEFGKCISIYSSDEEEEDVKSSELGVKSQAGAEEAQDEAGAEGDECASLSVDEAETEKSKVMHFACQDDVKDYIATEYGVSRTQMRTLAAIKKAAESVGLEFVID